MAEESDGDSSASKVIVVRATSGSILPRYFPLRARLLGGMRGPGSSAFRCRGGAEAPEIPRRDLPLSVGTKSRSYRRSGAGIERFMSPYLVRVRVEARQVLILARLYATGYIGQLLCILRRWPPQQACHNHHKTMDTHVLGPARKKPVLNHDPINTTVPLLRPVCFQLSRFALLFFPFPAFGPPLKCFFEEPSCTSFRSTPFSAAINAFAFFLLRAFPPAWPCSEYL